MHRRTQICRTCRTSAQSADFRACWSGSARTKMFGRDHRLQWRGLRVRDGLLESDAGDFFSQHDHSELHGDFAPVIFIDTIGAQFQVGLWGDSRYSEAFDHPGFAVDDIAPPLDRIDTSCCKSRRRLPACRSGNASPIVPKPIAKAVLAEEIAHWNAMRPPSTGGKRSAGQPLKASGGGRPGHRLHRPKRIEPAAASLPYLGPARQIPLLHSISFIGRRPP